HKNDLNTTTGSPATSKPNWYYYWTKFVNFHPLCTSTLYSNLKPHAWAITHINEDLKGYTEFFDRSSEDNDILGTKNDKGLHVFNEVIAHESWHYNFYNMLWTTFGPGYVMSSLDLDGDLYPDEFEISQEGRLAGFMVRLYPDYIDKFDPNSSSNGTIYEELRAKVEELNLSGNYNELTKYDRFDWSYDRENKYQGKNWK
ncbi:MAG TPA: hypothetical protein PK209_11025, partial [Saprospiraceae bacterium]|nr:hypothetical protein [Saprospiraceae bacterium]